MRNNVIENIGKIARITVLERWNQNLQPEDLFSQSWKYSFTPDEDEGVELLIYYRGKPIDSNSAITFSSLIKRKPAMHGPEKLEPNEIISLRILMGFEHVGNNQYTNNNPPESRDGPAFDLRIAELRRLGQEVVLSISGKYRSGTYYRGIYLSADPDGRIIHQIGLNAPTSTALAKYSEDLDDLITNIEWHEF